jgi:hypothetical protein
MINLLHRTIALRVDKNVGALRRAAQNPGGRILRSTVLPQSRTQDFNANYCKCYQG